MHTTARRHELAARPVREAITNRGKALSVLDTVAAARRLFENPSVRVVPVLEGTRYAGAIARTTVRGVPGNVGLGTLAADLLTTATADTLTQEALGLLDASDSTRLVVLDTDGSTYSGLVCLRSDRETLCVGAPRHTRPADLPPKGISMSAISADAHVADLVLEQPSRARVFERYGIDYCCGGKTPLATACADRGVDIGTVIAALAEPLPSEAEDMDWTNVPVADLCDHIVERHHAYLRDELPPLRALVDKVAHAHSDRHQELREVQALFHATADELEQHMAKEEHILFPACVALESGVAGGFPFGSVENPIGMMLHEHDEVAAGLAGLRSATHGYRPPADACNSYRAMLERLAHLEADTHRHVHEENNILFPRAIALEAQAS
jgi:regulator of cell morphogenesis and NO signaling